MPKYSIFPCLVKSDDLTASPTSAICIVRVYIRMNIVIACPTARQVVIHPDTVRNLKFSLILFPKGEFLSIFNEVDTYW